MRNKTKRKKNKMNSTLKRMKGGLEIPGNIYSLKEFGVEAFEKFMDNVYDATFIGQGTFGITCLVASKTSPYKSNGELIDKLLLKMITQ
jgi:hypothetical protein